MPRAATSHKIVFDSMDLAVIRSMHKRGKTDLEIARYFGVQTARITRQIAAMDRPSSEAIPGRGKEFSHPYRDIGMGDVHQHREAAKRGSEKLLEAMIRTGCIWSPAP